MDNKINKWSVKIIRDDDFNLETILTINWVKIKETYPKSFKEFCDWYTAKEERGKIDAFAFENEYGVARSQLHWINKDSLVSLGKELYISHSTLCSFFDDNYISISTEKGIETMIVSANGYYDYFFRIEYVKKEDITSFDEWHKAEVIRSKNGYTRRIYAEIDAINKSFEIMEEQLNK